MFARWKFQVALIAIIAVFAVLAGAFRDEAVAYAQGDDRDYVDVSLTLEAPTDVSAAISHDLNIIVVNNGSRTAYDVEVVVDVVSPAGSLFRTAPSPNDVPVGWASIDGTSLRWAIPALGGLQREVLPALVTHEWPTMPNDFDNSALVHELSGEVTTASFESDLHKGNNTSRIWSYNMDSANDRFIQVGVNYTVDVAVDQSNPSPGDTVNFTVTAGRKQTHGSVGSPSIVPDVPPPIDLKVDIELTDGLSTGTPTFSRTHTTNVMLPASGSETYRDGVFNIGTRPARLAVRAHSMTLPATVASDAVVNEQCLTATLTGTPPPGNGRLDDDIADNMAKTCLGGAPDRTVVFNSGEASLLTWYNCVGRTTYPCSAADSVEIVALGGSAAIDAGLPYEVFKPDKVVIQVPDPLGRAVSSEEDSMALVWSTGYDGGPVMRPGVILNEEMVSLDPSQWGVDVDEDDTRAATLNVDVSGPGKLATWGADEDSREPYEWFGSATNGALTSGTWFVFPGSYPWFAEFGKLGTYRVDFDGAIAANNGTPINTADDTSYTIAERTYVFHIGPIAEVGVTDGGPSPYVAAGRNALTIVALNNGPEPALDAQVTGLPTGAEVLHVSPGSYNSTTGEWNIGELRPRSHYRSRGEPEPTLALSASAGATAEVSIAISETYKVCIGSDRGTLVAHDTQAACEADTANGGSWHEGTVYDYNTTNNTATVTAVAGTGGGDSAPASVTVVDPDASGVLVQWESPAAQVNGLGVKHYQLERSTSPSGPWTSVATKVTETKYQDTSPGRDNPVYRVRAVNEAGVAGPWSQISGMRPGVPGNFSAAVATGNTQVNLTWDAPAAVTGVTVTGYEIEVSADGGDNWTSLATGHSASPYAHTGLNLSPGDVRDYRVRTVGMVSGKTLKSPWATTRTEVAYPKPGVPNDFAASGSSDFQATLSWSAPDAVAGVSLTGYEAEFSKDGGNTWTAVTGTPMLDGTTYSLPHTDNTLGADVVRQYRVRAVGTVTSHGQTTTVRGDWAFAAATRDYPTPGAPRNFIADAINQSQVNLSWSEPEAVAGVRLTGYHLDFSTDGNNWDRLVAGDNVKKFDHIDDTLAPGAIRQYRVRAVGTDTNNAVFESGWVFASAATEAVGPPQNLTAVPDLDSPTASRTRIDLTWDQPAFGADLVTGYRIDRAPDPSGPWQTLQHSHNERSYQHTGRLPGERSCYRVAAIYAGGTGPFTDRLCATTLGNPADDLPGEPENLRVAQVGSNYVDLEWDPPSSGGAVEYYEWRSNIHTPTEVPRAATSVRVGSLPPGSTYEFQVRAGNSNGPGGWSQPIQVSLHRAAGAVKASPLNLEVDKGGSGSFNVRLNRSPQWPMRVYFIWEGADCLTESLPYQQGNILLPTNPPPSKEFWADFWWGPPEDRFAAPWHEGLDIQIDASGCQGGETAVIDYDLSTLPFSELEGLSLWEVLNLNEDEWREKWGVDPLDGTSGPSVKVTVVDGAGSGRAPAGEQGLASVNAGGTAVNVSVTLPPQATVWRREERGLYGSQPAWDWWD